ncbi:hypothetical protein ZWY2020_052448 [Hordeum vulgare]|nr:hypothetical protein ZWY2020_052448 [Hordeum vulgare]
MPMSCRDGLMCEYNGNLNHPKCFSNFMLDKENIDNIVMKLSRGSLETCSKYGLKLFCLSNPAPEKNSPFWKRKPKPAVKKVPTKTAPKKKTKGKAATVESSVVGESRAAEEHSEVSPPSSGDSAVLALPPLIRLQGAQAKKRRTRESSSNPKVTEKVGMSTSIPEAQDEPAEPHTKAPDDLPDIQDEPRSPQKEVAENLNQPSPQ